MKQQQKKTLTYEIKTHDPRGPRTFDREFRVLEDSFCFERIL